VHEGQQYFAELLVRAVDKDARRSPICCCE